MSGVPEYWKVWNKHNPYNMIEQYDGNVVHHIDEDRTNNHISNLQLMTRARHTSIHQTGNTHLRGVKQTPEHIAKRLANCRSQKGDKRSEVSRNNMSAGALKRWANYRKLKQAVVKA